MIEPVFLVSVFAAGDMYNVSGLYSIPIYTMLQYVEDVLKGDAIWILGVAEQRGRVGISVISESKTADGWLGG